MTDPTHPLNRRLADAPIKEATRKARELDPDHEAFDEVDRIYDAILEHNPDATYADFMIELIGPQRVFETLATHASMLEQDATPIIEPL